MKKSLYAIKDEITGIYAPPTPLMNDPDAYRQFEGFIENLGVLKHRAADYTCYFLGTFDDKTGIIEPECKILFLGSEILVKGE